jgi:hypothetical protein
MKKGMTPKEFWEKLCWEGGLYEGFRYGLRANEIIVNSKNEKFLCLMKAYEQAFLEFEEVHEKTQKALANMGFEDD